MGASIGKLLMMITVFRTHRVKRSIYTKSRALRSVTLLEIMLELLPADVFPYRFPTIIVRA